MQRTAIITTSIATLILATGYALGASVIGVLMVLAIGGGWAAMQWRGRSALTGTGMIGLNMAAALGILGGFPPLMMLLGAVAALMAWDLDHAGQRIRQSGRVEDEPGLLQARLRWLAPVALIGALSGSGLMIVRLRVDFVWLLLLGLIAALLLRRILAALRPGDS